MSLRGVVRLGLSGLLLVGGGAGTILTGAGQADASASDGTLTVQVLRDFFGTGVINSTMDVPQRGMKVEVADSAGNQITGVTDVTGKVIVPPSNELTGGRYRVDVTVPTPYSDYLRAAPASTAPNHFDSFTTFVDVSDGQDDSVITGVWDPADYALPDSRYFVPIQSGATGTETRALVAFGTDARGNCPDPQACPEVINTQDQVGTTYGLAYDRYREQLFQSSFARRYTEYGPDGGNAIYTVAADGSATKLFAKVPGATKTAHDTGNLIKDAGFTDAPGKESVGGLALSDDGSTLYAVNLLTRSLVSFDATKPTASAPEATVPIPDPGCASADDWRPFSVAINNNTLHVGGVCSAESTQERADLKAVVATYDGEKFTTVLSQVLDFERGAVLTGTSGNDQVNHWNPWNTDLADWDGHTVNGWIMDPQPELASLAFARDGSLILGFRDRFMDVVGWGGLDPRPGNDTPQSGMAGGDINMACATPTGGYEWEGTGNCADHATDPTLDGVQPPASSSTSRATSSRTAAPRPSPGRTRSRRWDRSPTSRSSSGSSARRWTRPAGSPPAEPATTTSPPASAPAMTRSTTRTSSSVRTRTGSARPVVSATSRTPRRTHRSRSATWCGSTATTTASRTPGRCCCRGRRSTCWTPTARRSPRPRPMPPVSTTSVVSARSTS